MLNNLVILSDKFGIWDFRGKKLWDLGFEGQNLGIWDLRGQKFRDLGFEG